MTTYYVTQYSVTTGRIAKVECEPSHNPEYVRPVEGYQFYHIDRDAFETAEDALADAESRRKKKIASVEKQLAKLRAMKFTVPE